MRQKSNSDALSSEEIVKGIRRATRKRYSAEEKIRIVLDGLRGEHSIAELCRREGIAEGLYYSWSKEFLEAGKRRLAGDTARAPARRRSLITSFSLWVVKMRTSVVGSVARMCCVTWRASI
jgi:transposase